MKTKLEDLNQELSGTPDLEKHDPSPLSADFSEIVIAFVAPAGVDLTTVENAVQSRLSQLGYKTVRIRVTADILPKLDKRASAGFANDYDRITTMMDVGTDARGHFGDDIIALGVAAEIAKRRPAASAFRPKTAYLVHSLKHPSEVRRFREIYPRGFYLIGVNAPFETRQAHLLDRRGLNELEVEEITTRDKKEDLKHGQQVNQTFHLADFFVGWAEDEDRIVNSVHRFVDILFADPHRTPTFGEYAMFMAFSASLRSGDLSRQVGAVIARDGEILATGANDCPKAGGGLYWPCYNPATKKFEDIPNGRDSVRGKDSNRREQLRIIEDVAKGCKDAGLGKEEVQIVRAVLDDSRIRDLTEYGRVVHAEMAALLSCARKGISTQDATIYCTTFPCHNCAKHIIAAGIRRVVFVEPYLKSKACPLHDEVIKIGYPEHDGPHTDEKTVRFEPFFGLGPRRFFDLFSMNIGVGTQLQRKDDESGEAISWEPTNNSKPRVRMLQGSYLELEKAASDRFKDLLSGSQPSIAIVNADRQLPIVASSERGKGVTVRAMRLTAKRGREPNVSKKA